MTSSPVTQFVVTFRYHETGLSNLLELNSTMANAGFSTTLNDSDGHPHELGTNNFGIVSALSLEELREQAQSIGELVLGKQPEVEVRTLESFNKQDQS
ncbi:type V toxin-antitoxin system endoribonuclease antitoxin GhoS [Erwinia sp. S38]|uniref:type V toxin-antitoxin system endoribonuclease antitoxin GhoS n=1 Tax=Erwinia sp. S38 TaxID=2769338 RepID=UPI00190A41F3|nr:type V toxin-antitoxin system endoribonuclease antitoxin GhoS [Erwinia sp. S38]MBK0000593.1 type V toxin-antitoxin system endoribonuclease antitoxin GhoS [Erwinia sp. S38]